MVILFDGRLRIADLRKSDSAVLMAGHLRPINNLKQTDLDPGCLAAPQAQAIIAQPDFDGVAKRREADDFQLFPFQETHFEEALDDGITTFQAGHPRPLAPQELIQGGHGQGPWEWWAVGITGPCRQGRRVQVQGEPSLTGAGNRANQDVHRTLAAQAQATAADLEQARASPSQHAQTAAGPYA